MPNLNEQIAALLQDETLRNALSATAYKALSATMEESKTLAVGLETAQADVKRLNQNIAAQQTALSSRDVEIQGLKTRVAAFEKREGEFLRNEIRADFNEKRVKDHQDMFALVFRNLEVRRATVGTIPVGVPGSNGSSGYVSNYDNSSTDIQTQV